MKIIKPVVANALLLLGLSAVNAAASPANTPSIAECRSICGVLRDETLKDASACQKAKKQGQGHSSKLFHGCVEARKKAFTQACVPTCAKAELSISSFDACSTSNYKKHGVKYVEWCRKGYDSILTSLESLLANHRPTKQVLEAEEPTDVPAEVVGETSLPQAMRRELVKDEVEDEKPVKSEEEPAETGGETAEAKVVAEAKEEPISSEAKSEPVEAKEAPVKSEPKSEPVEARSAAEAKEEPVKSENVKVQNTEASESTAKDVEDFNAGRELADSSEAESGNDEVREEVTTQEGHGDATSENEVVDHETEL